MLRIGELFDHTYASHQMGVLKPQAAAFAHVVSDLGVPAQRVAFFDDTPVNVEAAAGAGLAAFHVVGVAELCAVLVAAGIQLRRRPVAD